MPRTCLACSSSERAAIDKALVAGESLRNISERVSISPEQRKEKQGLDLLVEAERIRHKAWELPGKLEAEGDHRGSVVALREIRECLATLGNLLSCAADDGLSDVPDTAILQEAKRRGLKLPVDIRVVYDRAEIKNPDALRESRVPGAS